MARKAGVQIDVAVWCARSRRKRPRRGGILLPATAREKLRRARVLAVGDGKISEDTGERIQLDVSEGAEALYTRFGGTEIKVRWRARRTRGGLVVSHRQLFEVGSG